MISYDAGCCFAFITANIDVMIVRHSMISILHCTEHFESVVYGVSVIVN